MASSLTDPFSRKLAQFVGKTITVYLASGTSLTGKLDSVFDNSLLMVVPGASPGNPGPGQVPLVPFSAVSYIDLH